MYLLNLKLAGTKIGNYAKSEFIRLWSKVINEELAISTEDSQDSDKVISLEIDTGLHEDEIVIEKSDDRILLAAGSPQALLHCVYTFYEKSGCVFELSGEIAPENADILAAGAISIRSRPSVKWRGIRMHLNFAQDQSFFTEDEFAGFIDNVAKQRFNYLIFHMYTHQQWFPFSYRGIKHLELRLGNFPRKSLRDDMIGRDKVHAKDHWFPREFEHIVDVEELLEAVYSRYKRMMSRAVERGIHNCVAFEPAYIPPAMADKIPEWSKETFTSHGGDADSAVDWQQEWSSVATTSVDVRNPVVIDISVERCLQCIDAFPDMHELQLISREGTEWRMGSLQTDKGELSRILQKFDLPDNLIPDDEIEKVVSVNDGPEMHAKAHPYWTVLPGNNFYPTVLGSLRFIEFALAVLDDKRLQDKIKERNLTVSLSLYSPNPVTIKLVMPAIAKMVPKGVSFHCLADYGANDIAANLPAWQPLKDEGVDIGLCSWLEFDGTMMIGQNWMGSLHGNIKGAKELGVSSIYFNHWRIRSLEHNAAVAAALSWDASMKLDDFKEQYFSRLFGTYAVEKAVTAYKLLEEVTLYTKSNTYNIGFTYDWVYRNCTSPPGYYWKRLVKAAKIYEDATKAFSELALSSSHKAGKAQAQYMGDICKISALHIWAVYHFQNAKLPLFGYNAWPLGNEHASWPPPDKLELLLKEARTAVDLEKQYMTVYANWVSTCDEQGQLCIQQQGIMEPFSHFVDILQRQLDLEKQV